MVKQMNLLTDAVTTSYARLSITPHASHTDAGNVGSHGNPTSREPARWKESKSFVCDIGKTWDHPR